MLKDIKAFSTFSQKKEQEIATLKEQKAALSKSKSKGNKQVEQLNEQIEKYVEDIMEAKEREQNLTNQVNKLKKKLLEL
jgi:uncharacterized coiled-coil DUF342 family protein